MPTTTIEIPVILEVEYQLVENPGPDRTYPVDIIKAKMKDGLGIGQIMELQRIIHEANEG